MTFISRLPKLTDSVPKLLGSTNIAFFLDRSGSTSSRHGEVTVLQAEHNLVTQFGAMSEQIHVVVWDTTAVVIEPSIFVNYHPNGDTTPTCIFDNDVTSKIFDCVDSVVFTTDGQIADCDVIAFSKKMGSRLNNKALIVCVLFAPPSTNPNISVFAPFMTAKNLLILHTDGARCKVLHTQGDVRYSHSQGALFDLTTLAQVEVSTSYPEIPRNLSIIGETETEVEVFDTAAFYGQATIDPSSLSLENWDRVAKAAKMSNTRGLPQLRAKIEEWRQADISRACAISRESHFTPLTKSKSRLICQIVTLEAQAQEQTNGGWRDEENITKLNHLRLKLQELLPAARVEETETERLLAKTVYVVKTRWRDVFTTVGHYETASYTLADMTGISRKAHRAVDITEDEIRVVGTPKYSEAFSMHCAIHADQGPAVVWIAKPSDTAKATALVDLAIDCPLEYFPELQTCIACNPVCGDCAEDYLKHSSGLSLYRKQITGYVPSDVKNNVEFTQIQLCRALCRSKNMPHVLQLFLAMLDDCEYEWLHVGLREHMIRQLIYCATTDNLSVDGSRCKMTLREAICDLQSKTLIRQPFNAVVRLLIWSVRLQPASREPVMILLRECMTYRVIRVMSEFFRGSRHLHKSMKPRHMTTKSRKQAVKDVVYRALFTEICGLVCLDNLEQDIHLLSLGELPWLFSDETFAHTQKQLTTLAKLLGMTVNTLFSPQYLSLILYRSTTTMDSTKYSRNLSAYEYLAKTELFAEAHLATQTEARQRIWKNMVGQYHMRNDLFVSPYSCYLGLNSGQSKLWFDNQSLLSDEVTLITEDNLSDLCFQLQTRLAHKLKATYGYAHPNRKSGHINVHQTVAHILEKRFIDLQRPTDDNVYLECLEAIKRTTGKKGNIFTRRTIIEVICLVDNFCKVRSEAKRSPSQMIVAAATDRTVLSKLKAELTVLDLLRSGQIVRSKLEMPKCLTTEYQEGEINRIISKLDESWLQRKVVA